MRPFVDDSYRMTTPEALEPYTLHFSGEVTVMFQHGGGFYHRLRGYGSPFEISEDAFEL